MIVYRFTFEDGKSREFTIDPERPFDSVQDQSAQSSWTQLARHRCPHCPLDPSQANHCPPALDSAAIVTTFHSVLSYEVATVEVITPERTYVSRCDLQTALRALLGLVMATSACPILARLKGLARLHLPFASLEETLLRTAGAYLLKQYLVFKQGGAPDWELKGLDAYYQDLQLLNQHFKKRLDEFSQLDANLNAIGALINVSMGVSMSIEDRLAILEEYTL